MPSGSVWGVDIGKGSLKAVRMRRGKEGELEVQALFFQEYKPAEDGTIPPAESTNGLDALIAKHPEVKREPVFVALPGHTSFSRFIKLPAFDERKLAEMVRYEAQQQIPFPIGDVNWDYSLVDRDYAPDEDREVGLFAIKKELVNAFISDLTLSGIEPAGITTTPLAIYNFVCWDMELLADQATIVLDIGWNTTDLVIIDGARYWIRNLALNGHELTKAIATKLKVPFAEAEGLKRDAAQQKDARKLYGATELVLKDFVAEIQRSIAFYKAQNKERQVTIGQVLLLGNGAKLPNVRPFFQKELGFPVETVKRLSRLTLDVDIEGEEVEILKEHLPSFAVAFGLGIQACEDAVNEVNLLPEDIRRRQALEKKKPLVAVAVAVLWLTVVAAFLSGRQTLDRIADVMDATNRNRNSLRSYKAQILSSKASIPDLEAQVKHLKEMTAQRNYPIEVLDKLAPVLRESLKGNGQVAEATADHKMKLKQNKPAGIDLVRRELQSAQGKVNDGKIWIVDLTLKETASGSIQASILCARKYIRGNAGDDELATKNAIETGVLAPVKGVFKNAHFEGQATVIYNLDKGLQPPPGPAFESAFPKFMGMTIVFEYPEPPPPSIAATDQAEKPR